MRKSCILASVLTLAAAGCVTTTGSGWGELHGGGHVAGYYTNLGGSVSTQSRVGGSTVSGSFNVDRVGQGSNTLSPQAEVHLGFTPLEFALSGFDYSESASGQFNGSFLGQKFSGPVRSDFDVRAIQATGGLDVLRNDLFRVGALVGLHYLDADVRLDGGSGIQASFDDSVTVPVVGVRGDVGILPQVLRAGGQITGMDIKISDYDATFFDMMAGIYYTPADPVEVVLGWKYTSMELDGDYSSTDRVGIDLEFSGPFLGVGVRF